MQIIVQLKPAVARALQGKGRTGRGHDELVRTTRELGITLEPLHPGVSDPELQSFFAADVADPSAAEEVSTRLRQSRAVEAAYLKPADEAP